MDKPVLEFVSAVWDVTIVKPLIECCTGEDLITGESYIDTVYEIEIPRGTTVYSGPAGYQGEIYIGGKEQIFIPKPWEIDGVKVISNIPLK